MFQYDGVVLLYKNIDENEMLKLTRKYDNDWTTKRNDKYLFKLFKEYFKYSKIWVKQNEEIWIYVKFLDTFFRTI